MKTYKTRKIKPTRIPQPSLKSRKYLFAKHMAYTVLDETFIAYFEYWNWKGLMEAR